MNKKNGNQIIAARIITALSRYEIVPFGRDDDAIGNIILRKKDIKDYYLSS